MYLTVSAANGSPGGREMTRLISSHVEASKIGRQIAEEALDTRRKGGVTGGITCLGANDSSSFSSSPSPGLEHSQSSIPVSSSLLPGLEHIIFSTRVSYIKTEVLNNDKY
jgi:aryl hydrocarbon receptor nuclear translocator-like protein 1